ncbi:hypothetical protein BJ742DRAFT_769510 [Cladochytrium replicatum]|nr:hypothetical protein BJ742DRAFT_769510 [Cladochytrium replicatum]
MSTPTTAQAQQQLQALSAALTDLLASIPAILLSGAGCLAATTVFLWTIILLYRQRSNLAGASLNRRGVRAWLLFVAAAFNLYANAILASSFLHTVLLTEAWFYMSVFATSAIVVGVVSTCAVERFLIVLTNKTWKWVILSLAIIASVGNAVQHLYLMWLPTSVALTNGAKSRPVYTPYVVLISTMIPCILILTAGIGVFSVSLIKHLKQRNSLRENSRGVSSHSMSQASQNDPLYVVLVVHHSHLLATIAVYVTFGTALGITLNQSALRGPLAFFWYSVIIALESGLEDIAKTVNNRSNGSKSQRGDNGAPSEFHASATGARPRFGSSTPEKDVQVIQMNNYSPAFSQYSQQTLYAQQNPHGQQIPYTQQNYNNSYGGRN